MMRALLTHTSIRQLHVVLLPFLSPAINVEFSEVVSLEETYTGGMWASWGTRSIESYFGGVDPIDNDCYGGRCLGLLTRVREISVRVPRLFS